MFDFSRQNVFLVLTSAFLVGSGWLLSVRKFAALGAAKSAFAVVSTAGDVVAWGSKEAGGEGWEQSFLKGERQPSERVPSGITSKRR